MRGIGRVGGQLSFLRRAFCGCGRSTSLALANEFRAGPVKSGEAACEIGYVNTALRPVSNRTGPVQTRKHNNRAVTLSLSATMKIDELILDGFKSYAVRTTIDKWDPQFNAITVLR
jgi:hypothetical protein